MHELQLTLVELECRHCHRTNRPPILVRQPPSHGSAANALGAYCRFCNQWIKWVPQDTLWLQVERDQATAASTETSGAGAPPTLVQPLPSIVGGPDDPMTSQEETWIVAIAEMCRFSYDQAETLGFHDSGPRSHLELAMLIVTECAELSEWSRHGGGPSDHIPAFSGAEEEFADILIRVFDHALEPSFDIDPIRLGQAVVAKLAFNRTRGYRHGGKTI